MSFSGLSKSKRIPKISKTRISLFVHNLAGNPIVRAAPIGFALERLGLEIEVLGILADGQQVYAPYASAFEYKTAPRIGDLPKLATGDLAYAFKPLPTSLLPALNFTKYGFRKPLLLDVEDDDLVVCEQSKIRRLGRFIKRGIVSPNSAVHGLTHIARKRCCVVTVATTLLQSFYGGTLLIHGPDERLYDPSALDQDQAGLRKKFGLPENKVLVLFAGKPMAHKGIEELVEAVAHTDSILVLAGNQDEPLFRAAKERLEAKCILLGLVNNQEMPRLLAAVDVVPVPQRDSSYARAQLPAKLIEAMAMGKSVIVTEVGDLPRLVGADSKELSGWIIPPNDARSLADAIESIVASPSLVQERNANARTFYEKRASISANAKILQEIFQSQKRLKQFL